MPDTTLVEWFLVGLAWLCGLNALLFGVLLLVAYLREPPRWWVRWRIPDFVPDDWTGGDREQTKPDREPHR